MQLGFIGLGLMGKPIAVNLIRAGFDVTVVNRSQGKVRELAGMGARAGASPADAARGADVIGLCLIDGDVVGPVLCGGNGVLDAARPGTIVLDHSTVHPEFARRMAAACAERGVIYLDAPVSGTGQVAWDGGLTVMAGGDADAFERARPVLDAVSANARLMGPVGSGSTAKLINNMVKDINQVAVMETFVLAAKLGMDCGALFEAMRRASAASRQLERAVPKILDRSFTRTTYVSTNVKDQEQTGWLIERAGIELPLRNAARDHWLRAAEQGLAEADSSESIKVLEREAGVEVAGALPVPPPAAGEAVAGPGAAAQRRDRGEKDAKLAFIGLGMMGRPIAENVVRAGLDVAVVNRSQGKVRELVALGAKPGATPAAAAADADIVALCLADEETIDRVMRGGEGVLSTARPGTVVIDHSTVHPEFARGLAASCADRGVTYLDAPVSGTGQVARDGRLTVMAGGDAEAFARVRPELDAISAHAFLMGPVGSGSLAKLMNNMTADVYQIAIMEAFVLAAKLGMDVDALFAVMQTASASTRQLGRIGPKILDRAFVQTSRLSGHARGQETVGMLARQAGIGLPLREVAADVWRRGVDAGLGPGDPAKAVTLYERAAGGRGAALGAPCPPPRRTDGMALRCGRDAPDGAARRAQRGGRGGVLLPRRLFLALLAVGKAHPERQAGAARLLPARRAQGPGVGRLPLAAAPVTVPFRVVVVLEAVPLREVHIAQGARDVERDERIAADAPAPRHDAPDHLSDPGDHAPLAGAARARHRRGAQALRGDAVPEIGHPLRILPQRPRIVSIDPDADLHRILAG